jgi:hypothetical protein
MKYLLFLPTFLFATTTNPITLDFNIGYREDNIKWRIEKDSNSVIYSEIYSNLNFMTVEGALGRIYRDIAFGGDFSYSFIGSGDLQQKTVAPDFLFTDRFFFNTKGFSYSASGYLGYFVNLTPDRLYTTFFLPHFGYFYSREKICSTPTDNSQLSTLPDNLNIEWRSPFLGINAGVIPNDLYAFSIGYAFHFMHLDLDAHIGQQTSTTELLQKVSTSEGGNKGHFGFLLISRRWPCWTVSFLAKLRYYTTETNSFSLKGEEITSDSSEMLENKEKFKLRQTALMILLSIAREF